MLEAVTEAQWHEFDANGVVSLGVALNPAELACLSERLDAIMLRKVSDVDFDRLLMQREGSHQSRGHKGPTLQYRKIQGLEHDPVVMSYLRTPLFRAVGKRIYPGSVGIYRTMFFNKPQKVQATLHGGSQLGWHQDRWSTLDRDPRITVYMAIDEASESNGCMHIIPRSHTLGVINPQKGAAFLREGQAEQILEAMPSRPLPLQPGEVVLLSTYCLHSSGVVSSLLAPVPRSRRYAVGPRYQEAAFLCLFSLLLLAEQRTFRWNTGPSKPC
jgi:phytanoyl-CoA hydroxylase